MKLCYGPLIRGFGGLDRNKGQSEPIPNSPQNNLVLPPPFEIAKHQTDYFVFIQPLNKNIPSLVVFFTNKNRKAYSKLIQILLWLLIFRRPRLSQGLITAYYWDAGSASQLASTPGTKTFFSGSQILLKIVENWYLKLFQFPHSRLSSKKFGLFTIP